MKRLLNTFLALIVLLFCTSATLEQKGKKSRKAKDGQAEKVIDADVYGFGFAASFVDTLAYYTEIQCLDSARLSDKMFLEERYQYSYQLKDYIERTFQKDNYVCMIFFSPNKKKIQKDFNKLLEKYKNSGIRMQEIPVNEFKYKRPED